MAASLPANVTHLLDAGDPAQQLGDGGLGVPNDIQLLPGHLLHEAGQGGQGLLLQEHGLNLQGPHRGRQRRLQGAQLKGQLPVYGRPAGSAQDLRG